MDVAQLKFSIDATQVKTAEQALTRLDTAAEGVERSAGKAERATDRFAREVHGVSGSAQRAATATDRLRTSIFGLSTATQAARTGLAAMSAYFGARAAYGASQSYIGASNSLKVMGVSASAASERLGELNDLASDARTEFGSTVQLYQRTSMAQQSLGASSEELIDFTQAVTYALGQQGGASGAASGALIQLSQAMSGGTVRAEEFNSILEGAYPLALAAAKGIDEAAGSVGKLRNMVIEGEVSSREFFEAILSQSDDLKDAFEKSTPTIGGALTVLSNRFTELVGRLDGGLGASEKFAQMILSAANGVNYLADNVDMLTAGMDRLVYYGGVAASLWGVHYLAALAKSTSATLLFERATKALRVALLRVGVGALVVGALVVGAGAGAGAGELLYQFDRLSNAVGGVSEAFSLLFTLGKEVWANLGHVAGHGLEFILYKLRGWASKADVYFGGIYADALGHVGDWANGTINAFTGAKEALEVIWSKIPAVIGNAMMNAVNGVISGIEKLIKKSAEGINKLISPINKGLELLNMDPMTLIDVDAISLEKVPNKFAGAWENAISEVKEAFASVQGEKVIEGYTKKLLAQTEQAKELQKFYAKAADYHAKAAVKPLESWQKIQDAIAKANETKPIDEATDATTKLNAALEDTDKKAKKSKKSRQSAIQQLQEQIGREYKLLWLTEEQKARLEAQWKVREALAKDEKTWSQAKIDHLAGQITGLDRVKKKIEELRGVTKGFFQDLLSGDIKGAFDNLANKLKSTFIDGLSDKLTNWVMGSQSGGSSGGPMNWLGKIFGMGGTPSTGTPSPTAGSGTMGQTTTMMGKAAPYVAAAMTVMDLAKSFYKKEIKGSGVQGTLSNYSLAQSWKKTKHSEFWGMSSWTKKSRNTDYGLTDHLQGEVNKAQNSINKLSETIGLAANDFEDVSHSFKFDTRGMSSEAVTKRLGQELEAYADKAARAALGTSEYNLSGENHVKTLERLGNHLTTVNMTFKSLGYELKAVSLVGADAASTLVQAFGDLEKFTQATDYYYSNFYSDAEKTAAAQAQLIDQLKMLGMDVLPSTKEQFRFLAEAVLKMGDTSGYAGLLKLAPQFIQHIEVIKKAEDDRLASAKSALEKSKKATQDAYDVAVEAIERERNLVVDKWSEMLASLAKATQDAKTQAEQSLSYATTIFDARKDQLKANFDYFSDTLKSALDEATQSARNAKTLFTNLNNAVNSRLGIADQTIARAQALATLRASDMSDQEGISSAVEALNRDNKAEFGTYADYAFDYARTTAVMRELRDKAQDQLTTEEQISKTLKTSLEVAETQYKQAVSALDGQLQSYQKQIDAINGVDTSVEAAVTAIFGASATTDDVLSAGFLSTKHAELAAAGLINSQSAAELAQHLSVMAKQNQATQGVTASVNSAISAIFNASSSEIAGISGLQNVMSHVSSKISSLATATQAEETASAQAEAEIEAAEKIAQDQLDMLNKNVAGVLAVNSSVISVKEAISSLKAALNGHHYSNNAYLEAQKRVEDLTLQETQRHTDLLNLLTRREQIVVLDEKLKKAHTDLGARPSAVRMLEYRDNFDNGHYNRTGQVRHWAHGRASDGANYKAVGRTFKRAKHNLNALLAQKNSDLAQRQGTWDNTVATVLDPLRQQIRDLGGIPKFAKGGFHYGGLRIVGEKGPELEATGPSRIHNTQQLHKLMDQSALVNALREVKSEIAALRSENRQLQIQVVKNTQKTARSVDEQNKFGISVKETA